MGLGVIFDISCTDTVDALIGMCDFLTLLVILRTPKDYIDFNSKNIIYLEVMTHFRHRTFLGVTLNTMEATVIDFKHY